LAGKLRYMNLSFEAMYQSCSLVIYGVRFRVIATLRHF